MKVLKFGGSSVKNAERILNVIEIIIESKRANKNIAVTVSALGGITDNLIGTAQLAAKKDKKYKKSLKEIEKRHLDTIRDLIKNDLSAKNKIQKEFKELESLLKGIYLVKEVSLKTIDLIMSLGERLSAFIISETLNEKNIKAEFLDARKLIKSDENFSNAKVDFQKTNKNILKYFKTHKKLQIITGFIASTERNETTTLGRGGSDYTASIFGAALNAKEIEIWTDVDGVMTADPRKVKKAFPLKTMTYKEAMEMSHFGAKVIHPPTMQPALNKNIPIRIKNTFNPKAYGTLISSKNEKSLKTAKGITSIDDTALLRLQGSGLIGVTGVAKRLFGTLAEAKINIIMISQASSEHSICFAIKPDDAALAKTAIENEFALEIVSKLVDEVIIEQNLSIIAVIGENMKKMIGVSGRLFQALGSNGINVIAIAQGSSELNISIVISKKNLEKGLNAIHDSFFLSDIKTLNLFLIGTGLIGSTLLEQIKGQHAQIKNDLLLDLNTVALANSKKMIFKPEGINLNNLEKELKNSKTKMDIKKFVKTMINLNLPNSIFIDCTASEEIPNQYEKILKNSISVVTPNKKANSSNIKRYLKLNQTASKSNTKFMYETNVGAGLPIIHTIRDLQITGDKILKIEAVLSGTLSYIFNSFDGKKPFSQIVKEAREKGYTEPDPRDDLNGLDVARKLLILAREKGELLEMQDIQVENLVPESLKKAKSIDEFFLKLKKNDVYFEQKRKNAEKQNKKLCYIASLEDKTAKVSLKTIDQNHPFYNLAGSDNIISLTTTRYFKTPLVIKGPGAGAEVTAAGVFSDILRIANISFNTHISKFAFLEKLKKNKLVISLIGMSNTGKTFWSKRLTKLGFKHINCDDLIEEKLSPKLKKRGLRGIKDVAKWLGQPYEKRFKDNQKEYLKLEEETMEEVLKKIEEPMENIVLDTTGSVIYSDTKILSALKKHALIIHIKSTKEMKEKMLDNFKKHPKPLIWGNVYHKMANETPKKALERCYMKLLSYRGTEYEKHADLSIPYNKVNSPKIDEDQFLKLIQEKL